MLACSASASRTVPLFHAVPVCHSWENPERISTAALAEKDKSVDTLVW
jgi:hypothetical protein